MAQWNAYSSYWQYPCGPYPNQDYPQSAQTYDYNHQTAVSTPAAAVPSDTLPPPPGIDPTAEVGAAEAGVVATSTPDSSSASWTAPSAVSTANSAMAYYPYTYPPMTSDSSQSQMAQPFYPTYNVPPTPWPQPFYAYPPYQQQNMFGSYPGWGYPPTAQPPPNPCLSFCNAPTMTNGSIQPPPSSMANSQFSAFGTSASLQEPPATLRAKGTKEQWTDELKDYVQRAFCSIDTSEEKDQMERILKEKLEYIFRNDIKIDWTKENIPTIPSKALAACRAAGALRASSVNVVRPMHLLSGPRSARNSGGTLRLPVGMLARGRGRVGLFSTANSVPNSTTDRAIAAASLAAAAINKKIAASEASPVTIGGGRSRSRSRSPFRPSANRQRRRQSEQQQMPPRRFSRSRSRSSLSSRSRRSSSRSSSVSSRGGGDHSMRSRSQSRRWPRSNTRSRSRSQPRKLNFRYYDNQRSPPVRGGGRKRARGLRSAGGVVKDSVQTENATDLGEDNNTQAAPNVRGSTRGVGRAGGRRGGKQRNLTLPSPGASDLRLSQRANRFKDHLNDVSALASGPGTIARTTSQVLLNYMGDDRDELSADFAACQIVGTMQELEKPYLRLTRAPEPSEVRPLPVLKLALEHVKQKLMEKKDYRWICEQFKSIRQDLTVQCIEDEFAAHVYETHADAALDASDFEEFHQCQSQLLRLYKDGLVSSRFLEFTAYRLLYYIFTMDLLGINTILAGLRPAHKSNPCIRFALNVRSAWSLANYHRLFQLIYPQSLADQPPLKCRQVVQWFIGRERKEAIKIIFKVCVISDRLGLLVCVQVPLVAS